MRAGKALHKTHRFEAVSRLRRHFTLIERFVKPSRTEIRFKKPHRVNVSSAAYPNAFEFISAYLVIEN